MSKEDFKNLVFTVGSDIAHEPDGITHSYSLISGLSDRNLTPVAMNLVKIFHNSKESSTNVFNCIPEDRKVGLAKELMIWNGMTSSPLEIVQHIYW